MIYTAADNDPSVRVALKPWGLFYVGSALAMTLSVTAALVYLWSTGQAAGRMVGAWIAVTLLVHSIIGNLCYWKGFRIRCERVPTRYWIFACARIVFFAGMTISLLCS
jgi:hypothetical protein